MFPREGLISYLTLGLMIFPRESGLDHNPVQRCGIIFSEGNDDEEKKDVQPRVQA